MAARSSSSSRGSGSSSSRGSGSSSSIFFFALFCCSAFALTASKHLSTIDDGFGDVANLNQNHNQNHHHQLQQQSVHHQQRQHQHSAATHHRRRLQRDSRAKDTAPQLQCEAVKGYFESIDIRTSGFFNEKGTTCGGNCCNNVTEQELLQKAASKFEQLLHHHTSSLRGILETTASQFQSHVLELAEQSENRTLGVFSTVFSRMAPLSRKLIHQLYTDIINHLKYTSNYSNGQGNSILNSQAGLEAALHKFFVQLFPIAYHQAVHISNDNYGELHEDYINCLKHNFDAMEPFAHIPEEIETSLQHALHTSNIFMNALLQSAEVFSETDKLYASQMSDACKLQQLKMHYCPNCNGHTEQKRPKICYSYCTNVMRGCSAQYSALLDNHWNSVAIAMDNLVGNHISGDSGITNIIRQLDTKLSDAIMKAMLMGEDLQKKVKKTCGTPNLLPSQTDEKAQPLAAPNNTKWSQAPDPQLLNFLSTIDKSKDFYINIVSNYCDDDYTQRDDRLCWTGDRVGDYTQLMVNTNIPQRYNPEVPWDSETRSNPLNVLVDKLIKIRHSIGSVSPVTNAQMHDIQSDMGHEGSGAGGAPINDDDEEYGGMHNSGDGSGDGSTTGFDTTGTTPNIGDEKESRENSKGASSALTAGTTSLLLTLLVTLFYSSCS